MPRGRYQQKQWEDRQDAIVTALETLSAERGFANVTMDDVAEAVGISKATLYQHFTGKEALLVYLLTAHIDRFLAWLDGTAHLSPLERLRQSMRYLLDQHITPVGGLISLGREEILPVFRSSPELVSRHTAVVEALTAIIQQGQAGGEIDPALAPHSVLGAMLALSSVSMGGYEPPGCNRQMLRAEPGYGEQMIALFERAIRPIPH